MLVALAFAAGQAQAFEWTLVRRVEQADVVSATYISQDLPVNPGGFIYTDDSATPVPFPANGPYAITGILGEIVNEMNESVPLSECYDHHWVIKRRGFQNAFCPDGPVYTFGVGAESRNTPVKFPRGYGYRMLDDDAYWGANIHLIRTQYLAGDDAAKAAKECNECYYAPGKGCLPRQNGTFSCCGDTSMAPGHCPLADDAPSVPAIYRLRYTVNYTDYAAVEPARVGVWTTPDCATYYQVLHNETHPEQLSSTSFTPPFDMEILLAIGHQHVGAINISLFVNDVFVCASYPTYGTDPNNTAGNEQGYLVKISYCYDKDDSPAPLVVRRNDTVRLDSWYWTSDDDPRIAPLPGGTHLNVMGYMFVLYSLL
ncbi:hypothetical protein CTAYLR_010188 [Chrysophaeum taylorii]|uniref:Uncharacterized protein n=1 Tax=Chrysophaeum taylorii TaxID=2483200 RepID=A0AAD7U5Q4_9STRA|nr:hypothetical protein CTAYLR_010188 [Chrysophaeum taylorii]